MNYITLNNGVKMPQLGYGVLQLTEEECETCVVTALRLGYRLLDTAQIYGNEEAVGRAIKKSKIPREDIFLTTKVWPSHYSYEGCRASVKESMKKLQVDYLDLCLLHQPFGDVYTAYRVLEDLNEEGVIRSIGISNFMPDRMVDLASFNRIVPAVNQIEIHPHYQQEEAMIWNRKYNVQLEAWAPFGEGTGNMFRLPELERIAEKHCRTLAQIVLRWHIQRGIVAIPKSRSIAHMKENMDVFDFELDAEDMESIARLDTGKSSFISHTDPKVVEQYVKRAR